MNMQLKYLYFIDTDAVTSKIENSLSAARSKTPSESFKIIFDCVCSAAGQYTEYLIPGIGGKTFFGLTSDADFIDAEAELLHIIKNSLQNNLILYSYFDLLQNNSVPVRVTAAHSASIRKGYKHYSTTDNITNEDKENADSVQFTKRKNITNGLPTLTSLIRSFHSDGSIEKCEDSVKDKNAKKTPIISVIPVYATLCDFLVTHHSVTSFTRSLQNSPTNQSTRTCINLYNNLYKDYYRSLNTITDKTSKVIFGSQVNMLYGFNFFYYAARYLHFLHELPVKSNSFTLKDIDGQSFYNSMQTLSELPLFYNKHVFLEYALLAFEVNDEIACYYLDTTSSVFQGRYMVKDKNKSHRTQMAITLFDHFVQTITQITFPILLSLWMVTIDNLLNRGFFSKDTLKTTLEGYINANFINDVSSDATCYTSKYIDNTILSDKFSDQSFCPSQVDIKDIEDKLFLIPTAGTTCSVRRNIDTQIKSYDASSSKNIFYGLLDPHNKADYNPLSPLYNKIKKDYLALTAREDSPHKDFLKATSNNLHNFIYNI